jgi:hypothetical protein
MAITIAGSISAVAQMTGTGPVNMMSGDVLAPVAGRGPGAFGSFWTTDLWLKGTAGTTVSLEFHTADSNTDAATAIAQVTMTSPVMYLADVMKTVFRLDAAFGNILIRGSRPVSATIRTYARAGNGSYGSSFMAMPVLTAMRGSGGMMGDDDQYRLYVQGLLPEPQARVNVVVTNAGSTPISGTMDVIDADGQPPIGGASSFPFSIRAYSAHQFGDVLAGFTSRFGDGSGMQVRVRLADGSSGMVMVLASVVDNSTNDGYTVMGSMMDSARGMMP